MIFSVAEIISYLSLYMTLDPSDVMATGTPPGMGTGKALDSLYLNVCDDGSRKSLVLDNSLSRLFNRLIEL